MARSGVSRFSGAAIAAWLAMVPASGAFADAVEWRVQDGGNGHWYQSFDWGAFRWADARDRAVEQGGHLATLTSAAESAFASDIEVSSTRGVMFGGYQSPSACEPGCGWRWVTDEPWVFTQWGGSQPDDYAGPDGFDGEDYLGFWNTASLGDAWSDGRDCLQSCPPPYFLVEWSADCNSNGVVDFGEIRAGLVSDTNGNNIPDACECGTHPEFPECCAGDVVLSGEVNGVDLAAVLGAWGTDGGKFPRADIDGNGVVDGADLAVVLSDWGVCE
jgi:hypothetical protein